jgi:hypothetical protein
MWKGPNSISCIEIYQQPLSLQVTQNRVPYLLVYSIIRNNYLLFKNPLIAYAYRRPLIKRCAKPFSLQSTEKAAHVCNTAIVKQSMSSKSHPHEGEDAIEEEEFFIDWNFEGL